jgi:membrane protease YdiL (CAAX protease family)
VIISYRLATKKFKGATEQGLVLMPVNSLLIISYFFVRFVFIACYEIWFRGLLLNYGIDHFGIISAILFNVGIYSLLHIVNGKQEMISCIPFGFLLCFLSIWQGSALPAVVIHLALTITYEFSFYRKTIIQSALI